MDAITLLKERRSVRKFKDDTVSRETMREVMDLSRWAPSWSNYQIARYTLVEDPATIQQLADKGVNDFIYNVKTLQRAKGVAILSYVKGKSGKLDQYGIEGSKDNTWEVFDAGIACQTFCLAAHAKGVGTCIMGVINEESIARIVNLPEDESAAALIVYGYEEGTSRPTPRLEVDEIVRFI